MSIFHKLYAFITRDKLHDFDLDNPVTFVIDVLDKKYCIDRYKCKKCDKSMSLDLWQMKSLPYSMKTGCK